MEIYHFYQVQSDQNAIHQFLMHGDRNPPQPTIKHWSVDLIGTIWEFHQPLKPMPL